MGNIYQYDNTPRYIERRAATFPRDMSIQAQYRYACDMRRANKHLYKEHTETHYCEIAYGASK